MVFVIRSNQSRNAHVLAGLFEAAMQSAAAAKGGQSGREEATGLLDDPFASS
jgi:hypothetical protein